jgi:hypothetical protein
MLGKVFARFVEKSPISGMVHGTLERVLGAEQLDTWFARTAQKQYTRTVLFSTVYDVLSQVDIEGILNALFPRATGSHPPASPERQRRARVCRRGTSAQPLALPHELCGSM